MFRHLLCWLTGHELTETVPLETRPDPGGIFKVASFLPLSRELTVNVSPMLAFDYTLRCRCGKKADPTVRNFLWEVRF